MKSTAAIESRVTNRVRKLNDAPFREKADYVLYWAQMNRRAHGNHALDYAVELANERDLPVLFYEGLTCTYKNANDRLHTFILEGVADTQAAVAARGIGYAFYLRRGRADRNTTVYDLAAQAAAVVTDDYPTFIAATHNARVPEKMDVAYFAVDSSCIVPMNHFTKREYAAYTIRPKIQKVLREHLHPAPELKPKRAWKARTPAFHVNVIKSNVAELVASCEIDHSVKPSSSFHGGSARAQELLTGFLETRLQRYAKERNEPSRHATSHMSPYLHFGQISALQIALQATEYAKQHHLVADEFLEELIVRRELAFNFARFASNMEGFDDLPDWAKKTMAAHAGDVRDPLYTAEEMESARTYDALWNATQKELLLRGKIHGYYRMYWGKKMIEWSRTYQDALDLMIRLHDRYALDGRDPNTYTNILWCFGLHDRPWFDRPIFGVMRYMSFEGMKRKTDIGAYIEEIAELDRTEKDPARVTQ
jgi:deoxyribodipyrimidine photo-lyase